MRDFVGGDGSHAPKIDRTFPEKTGAAFDVVSQNEVPVAEWPGEPRFGRAENRDHRHAQQRGEMHRAGIVGEQHTALTQLVDKFVERRLSNAIHAMIADCRRDLLTDCHVVFCAKQNPLRR